MHPIYDVAQHNATHDAQDSLDSLKSTISQRTVTAVQTSEYIARSEVINRVVKRFLKNQSEQNQDQFLAELVPFFQTSQASLTAFFTPEKKAIVGLGMNAPFGADFSTQEPIASLNCEKMSSGIANINEAIYSIGASCIYDETNLLAIVVVGLKFDQQTLQELSEKENASFHVQPSSGNAVSTFAEDTFAALVKIKKLESSGIQEINGERFAVISDSLFGIDNSAVAKIYAASSMADFDLSVRKAIHTVGLSVLFPFALTLLFLWLLGKRLISLVRTSTKLQHQIATTLRTRDTLRSMKTKHAAATMLSRQIYLELTADNKTHPSYLYLPDAETCDALFESAPLGEIPAAIKPIESLSVDAEPVFIENLLYAPVTYHGNKLGMLIFAGIPNSLDVTDMHFVSMMAGALGGTFQALNNLAETEKRVRKEATIAAEHAAIEVIQHRLLPNNFSIPKIEVATHYKAAESAGGDWYGWYFDEKRKVAYFLIGDVTGHGISSAIIAGVACGASLAAERSLRRYVDSSEDHIAVLMNILNNVICEVGHNERAMTMCVLAIETETGKFHWASAAHTHPFLVEAHEGKVRAILNNGPHLGHLKDSQFEVKSGALQPNDILVFYTDGLTENSGPDGSTFYDAALKRAVTGIQNVHGIKNRVLRTYEKIVAGEQPADDVSLLVVQWSGNQSENQKTT